MDFPPTAFVATKLLDLVVPKALEQRSALIKKLALSYDNSSPYYRNARALFEKKLDNCITVGTHPSLKILKAHKKKLPTIKTELHKWQHTVAAAAVYYDIPLDEAVLLEKVKVDSAMHDLVAVPPMTIDPAETELKVTPPPKKADKKERCSVCDNDYSTRHLCPKCMVDLSFCKRLPGYHSGKFKNDASMLRVFHSSKIGQNLLYMTDYILRKKDYKPPKLTLRVPNQPERDFGLSALDLTPERLSRVDRQMQRLQKYIDSRADQIIPQDGEISKIINTIFREIGNAVGNSPGTECALFLIGFAAGFAIVRLFISLVPPAMLSVLIPLVMAGVGVLGILVEAPLTRLLKKVTDWLVTPRQFEALDATYLSLQKHAKNVNAWVKGKFLPTPEEVEVQAAPSPTIAPIEVLARTTEVVKTTVDQAVSSPAIPDSWEAAAEASTIEKQVKWDDLFDPFFDFVKTSATFMSEGLAVLTGKTVNAVGANFHFLHKVASFIKDVETVKKTIVPIVEGFVGWVYETIFGEEWVPWSLQGTADEIDKLVAETEALAADEHALTRITTNAAARQQVNEMTVRFNQLEKRLLAMEAPPKYLGMLSPLRNNLNYWTSVANSAERTKDARPETKLIRIFGGSGIGKTTFTTQFLHDMAPFLHSLNDSISQTYNENMVFSRHAGDTRWDGYQGQPILLWDDAYNSKEDKLRMQQSDEIMRVVNTAPYLLEKAELKEKGNSYFTSLMAVQTDNEQPWPGNLGVIRPNAVWRRFSMNVTPAAPLVPGQQSLWRFKLFTLGQDKPEIIDYAKLLSRFQGLLSLAQKHHRKVVPVTEIEVKPDEDWAAKHYQNTLNGVSARNRTNQTNRQRKGKDKDDEDDQSSQVPEGLIEPQGSSESVPKDPTLEELGALRMLLDEVEIYVSDVGSVVFEIPKHMLKKCQDLGLKLLNRQQSTYERIVSAVRHRVGVIRDSIFKFGRGIAERIRRVKVISSIASFGVSVWNTMESAITRVKRFITDHPIGSAIFAVSALGILGLAIFAVYSYFRDAKSDPKQIEPQKKSKDYDKAAAFDDFEDEHYVGRRARRRARGAFKNAQWDDDLEAQAEVTPQIADSDIDVIDLASRSVWLTTCIHGTIKSTGQMVALGDRFAATAQHVAVNWKAAATADSRWTLTITRHHAGATQTLNVRPARFLFADKTEVAFVEFDINTPNFQKITQHFPRDAELLAYREKGIPDVQLVYRAGSNAERITVSSKSRTQMRMITQPTFPGSGDTAGTIYYVSQMDTPAGSSGGLLLTTNHYVRSKFLGLHVGATTEKSFDAVLSQEQIEYYIGELGKIVLSPQVSIEAAPKAPLHIARDQCEPIGVLKRGKNPSGKNTITESPIAQALLKHTSLRVSTVPTIMYATSTEPYIRYYTERGLLRPDQIKDVKDQVDPMTLAYSKVKPHKYIPPHLLIEAYAPQDYPQFNGKEYYILSPEQAVYGDPLLGIAPLDFSTSPGFEAASVPEKNREAIFNIKRDAAKNIIPNRFQDWDPKFQSDLILAIETLLSEIDHFRTVTVDSLKAERRKPARVYNGETRVFYSGSLSALVASRMILGWYTTVQKESCVTGVCSVGVSPISSQWGEGLKARSHLKHVIVTDSVNYDQHNQPAVSTTVGREQANSLTGARIKCESFMRWLTSLGKEHIFPEERREAKLKYAVVELVESVSDLYHVHGSILFRDVQVTGSGADRTSQYNTDRNMKRTRVAFIEVVRNNVEKLPPHLRGLDWNTLFSKCVSVWLYGDDQLIFVSEEVPFFNPYNYAKAIEEIFGDKLTLPSKEAITPDTPFAKPEDVEILKRGFRHENGITFSPLRRDVIEDSLFWVSSKKDAYNDIVQTCRSAVLEAAAHGRDYYGYIRGAIELAVSKTPGMCQPHELELPTYEACVAKWTR